jgi:hypothetical protein
MTIVKKNRQTVSDHGIKRYGCFEQLLLHQSRSAALTIAGHNLLADQGTRRCSGAFPNRLPGHANAHKETISASEAG